MQTTELVRQLNVLVTSHYPTPFSSENEWLQEDIAETCTLTPRPGALTLDLSTGTELDNLINGYELAHFIVLGGISLYAYERYEPLLFAFGSGECGLFVINSQDGGIYLLDHESGAVLFKCADHPEGFLGAVYCLMEYYFFRLTGRVHRQDTPQRLEYATKAAAAAGNEEYSECYDFIIRAVA